MKVKVPHVLITGPYVQVTPRNPHKATRVSQGAQQVQDTHQRAKSALGGQAPA